MPDFLNKIISGTSLPTCSTKETSGDGIDSKVYEAALRCVVYLICRDSEID